MQESNGNCLIGQSGGPTSVINASLCGAYTYAKQHPRINKVYGMVNGIQGFLEERIADLDLHIKGPADRELLLRTPASFLGSCRYKLPDVDANRPFYQRLFQLFDKYNIRHFIYIGGNDSMDTVYKLNDYIRKTGHPMRAVGVPKTIDNDLPGTDHCPGYGSAAKYIACTVKEIIRDAEIYNIPSVTIVEVMGRNAGWLTGAAALAREDGCPPPTLSICRRWFFPSQNARRISERAWRPTVT